MKIKTNRTIYLGIVTMLLFGVIEGTDATKDTVPVSPAQNGSQSNQIAKIMAAKAFKLSQSAGKETFIVHNNMDDFWEVGADGNLKRCPEALDKLKTGLQYKLHAVEVPRGTERTIPVNPVNNIYELENIVSKNFLSEFIAAFKGNTRLQALLLTAATCLSKINPFTFKIKGEVSIPESVKKEWLANIIFDHDNWLKAYQALGDANYRYLWNKCSFSIEPSTASWILTIN